MCLSLTGQTIRIFLLVDFHETLVVAARTTTEINDLVTKNTSAFHDKSISIFRGNSTKGLTVTGLDSNVLSSVISIIGVSNPVVGKSRALLEQFTLVGRGGSSRFLGSGSSSSGGSRSGSSSSSGGSGGGSSSSRALLGGSGGSSSRLLSSSSRGSSGLLGGGGLLSGSLLGGSRLGGFLEGSLLGILLLDRSLRGSGSLSSSLLRDRLVMLCGTTLFGRESRSLLLGCLVGNNLVVKSNLLLFFDTVVATGQQVVARTSVDGRVHIVELIESDVVLLGYCNTSIGILDYIQEELECVYI